jgi:uncharacterized protein (TIGR04255 family)
MTEETAVRTADEQNVPLGGIPAATREVLVSPEIELAVAEVRFTSSFSQVPEEFAPKFRALASQVGLSLAKIEPMAEHTFNVEFSPNTSRAQVEEGAKGWRFGTANGDLTITVLPSVLVVQTNRYRRWSESLAPALNLAVSAVSSLLRPTLRQRIGLRYVNRLTSPGAESVAAWSSFIDESLIGPFAHPVFGPRLIGAQQLLEIALEESSGAVVRHGPFRDEALGGSYSYLVDLDVFDVSSEVFSEQEIVGRLQRMNRTALALFQQCVTPDKRVEMGGAQ